MVAGVILAVLVLTIAPAAASYPQIRAEVGCDHVVRWTASAAPSEDPAERTNAAVEVARLGADGEWVGLGEPVAFDESNDYTASGSFVLESRATSVRLRVTALQGWGPGGSAGAPGEPRYATARVPEGCDDVPVAVSHRLDCATSAVDLDVSARPGEVDPGERRPLRVRVDGVVVRSIPVPEPSELRVPIAPGTDSRVQVDWDRISLVDVEVGSGCDDDTPRGVVIERCGPGSAVLAVAAPQGSRVDLRVGGQLALREPVPAGDRLVHYLALPPEPAPVEILIDDAAVGVGTIGGCDAPVAGVASCPSGDCPSAPEPSATGSTDGSHDDGDSLARTGPWERAVVGLIAAGLLLGGGAALYTAERFRPTHRSSWAAIAPYRQTWWDEADPDDRALRRRTFRFVRPRGRR